MNKAYIILAYTALFALSLLDNGRGPAYPDILHDFALNESRGSLIFSLASFSGLAINLTAHIWFKALGAIKGTYFSLCFLFLGGVTYFLSSHYSSFSVLILASIFLGIGLSLCTITMNILVARGSNDSNRRQLFAGLHSVYGVTSLLAPYILNALYLINMGWQEYFLGGAIICLIILFFNLSRRPEDLHLEQYKASTFRPPLSNILIYGLFFGLYVSSELIISSRLPLIVESVYSYNKLESAKTLSLFFLLLAIGRLTFSFIKIPIKSTTLLMSSIILTLVFLSLGLFYTPLFFPFLGLSMSYFFPVALEMLGQIFQENTDRMVTYIMTAISISLSVNHFLFGEIANRFGTLYGLSLVFFFQFICFGLLYYIKKGPQMRTI